MKYKVKDTKELNGLIATSGFTVTGFAKHIHASGSYFKDVLEKRKSVFPPYAKRVANSLGVSITDIFFEQDDVK
ncbi:hypothetical protein [Fructilactobacillus florum]|uniref:hypothetical protein n=1 Tax=Fructilactobacillus florum TaxID=640331 RepID=UPI00054FF18C|nr:hypothetical protein [Fructilactobacillus florum]